jgi:hypothetical protein
MKKPEEAESPLYFVIPAEAGIQEIQIPLDSCFRRSDYFAAFDEMTGHGY